MDQKCYTFLICPGAHGNIHKIHLRACVVELIVSFAIAGVIVLSVLANSYARMLLKVSNYNSVRAEREALRIECHSLQGAVTRTNQNLTSLQSLASEVALTYSFSDGQRPHLPANLLRVAALGRVGRGADYDASLCAFNMMKVTPLVADGSTVSQPIFANVDEDSATPSLWPVRGVLTAGFGERMDPFTGEGSFHTGVDIAAPQGTAVRAAADGILFQAGPEEGYGNEAVIDHGFGLTTKYAHLSSLRVVVGEQVSRGQIIGTVGMTGRATGPHLHYEVLVHGTPVNPATYLRE